MYIPICLILHYHFESGVGNNCPPRTPSVENPPERERAELLELRRRAPVRPFLPQDQIFSALNVPTYQIPTYQTVSFSQVDLFVCCTPTRATRPGTQNCLDSGDLWTLRKDCVVTEWTEWDACSRSCGSGHTKRQRQISRFPSLGAPVRERSGRLAWVGVWVGETRLLGPCQSFIKT